MAAMARWQMQNNQTTLHISLESNHANATTLTATYQPAQSEREPSRIKFNSLIANNLTGRTLVLRDDQDEYILAPGRFQLP